MPAEDAGGSKGIQILDLAPSQMTLKGTKRKTAAVPAGAAPTGPVEGAAPGTATKTAMTGTMGKSTKGVDLQTVEFAGMRGFTLLQTEHARSMRYHQLLRLRTNAASTLNI